MKKYSIAYLWLSAFLLLLAGCGQDEDSSSSTNTKKNLTIDFTVAGILANDIRFRVLAYKHSTDYAGYADYKISGAASVLLGDGLKLEEGIYSFVAYSYNSSDKITDTLRTLCPRIIERSSTSSVAQ